MDQDTREAPNIEDFVEYNEKRGCNVFKGTNIPVLYLWNAILENETLSDFLDKFPEVERLVAMQVVRLSASKTDGF